MCRVIGWNVKRWTLAVVSSCVVLTTLGASAAPIAVATINHPQDVDFQREILPIFRKKCLACHNATDAESNLVLESPATILKGGNEGASVVAGKPDESMLFRLAAQVDEPIMPPAANKANAEPLTGDELALLKLWIEQGAKGEVVKATQPIAWQPLPPGVNPVLAAGMSSDGQYLVAGRANQISVYDVGLQRDVARLIDPALQDHPATRGRDAAHLDLVQSIAISPDRQWIASGEYRVVKLWRRATDLLAAWQIVAPVPTTLTVSGDRLLVGRADGALRADDLSGLNEWSTPATTEGASGGVTCVTTSPTADRIARANHAGVIRITNREGVELAQFTAPAPIRSLLWYDAHTIVAGAEDHHLYVWTLGDDGQPAGEPRVGQSHQQAVTAMVRLPDGRCLSGSSDGSLTAWDVANMMSTASWNVGGPIAEMFVANDGKRLIIVRAGAKSVLWDLEKNSAAAEIQGQPDLRWQRDREALAQQIAQRHVDNANADLEEAKKRVTAEEESLKKVTEANDKAKQDVEAKQKAAQEAAAALQVAQETLTQSQQGLQVAQQALANAADEPAKAAAQQSIEPAQKKVTEGEADVKAKTEARDKTAGELKSAEQGLESAGRSLETSTKTLAEARTQVEQLTPILAANQERLGKQQAQSKSAEDLMNAYQHVATHAAVSPSGNWLVTIDAQGDTVLSSAIDGHVVRFLATRLTQPIGIAFAGEHELVVVASDGQVNRWRLDAQWHLAHTIGSPEDGSIVSDRATALAFSPQGDILAIGGGQPSRGGEIKLWQVNEGKWLREISEPHSDTVFGLAFSPSGEYLASCAADRFMKVFEVATGNHVRTFEGHTHHVLAVAWRADGRVLATGGADKVVKLWNFVDGAQLRTIQGFGKEVTSIEFAGASDGFFAACGDQSLYRCEVGGDRKALARGDDFLYVVRTNLLGNAVAFGGHDSVVRLIEDNGKSLAELRPAAH